MKKKETLTNGGGGKMKKKETLTIEISEEKTNGLKFYSARIPEINSAIIGTGDTKKDALIDLCRIYFVIKDEDILEGILEE